MKKTAGELVVIVVGVLIALLAENVWSARADDAKATDYIDRVVAELASNRVELGNDQAWVDAACPSSRDLLDHVRGQQIDEEASALLHLAVAGMLHNAPDRSTATYDDLVTTGSLGLIQDASTREAILSGYAALVGREAYRPSMANEFRRMVTQTLPEPFISRVILECLISADGMIAVQPCSELPESESAEALLGRLLSSPGFERALAERVFSICQFDYHVDLIGTELDAVAEVLDQALEGEAF